MGLKLINPDVNINFIGARKIAFLLSVILILVGVSSLVMKGGPRYGVDFAGGIMVQIKVEADREIVASDMHKALDATGLPGLQIQEMLDEHSEFLVRTSTTEMDTAEVKAEIAQAVEQNLGAKLDVRRTEMVGPKVSDDLRSNALEALFYVVLLIAIYISGRFEQRWLAAAIMAGSLFGGIAVLDFFGLPMGFLILGALAITVGLCWFLKLNYALGAVVALIHDVIITVGVFSLLNKEFDLTIVAALLTIIGYSLNDTIIVFDRIRENVRGKGEEDLARTVNTSINQTLSRTILTSGTTLFVVAALYVLGGGVIHDFALALLVGVFVGTYSSIFVASPILLGFGAGIIPEDEEPDGKVAKT